MPITHSNHKSSRGNLFFFIVGTCSVLATVCVCLVVVIILLRSNHSICGVSAGEIQSTVVAHSDKMIHSGSDMSTASKSCNPWEKDFRIPSDTDPIHYDILLHPDLNKGTFVGKILLQINVTNTRSFLVVNTKHLDIYNTRLTKFSNVKNESASSTRKSGEESEIEIQESFEYKPNEFWVIVTKTKLQPGVYNLWLDFRGNLTGKLVGLYSSIYKDSRTHEKRKIATSKFEPTYARQAYPCFDEPGFKPTYKIRLVRPRDGYIALSNMNQVYEVNDMPETGLTTVEFAESVPMSTYLNCFIVCDFDRLSPVTISQGFPFSVYSTPGQINKTKYALHVGSSITEFYIQYFGIPYPLPKLDLIAIPDFVSGAMEHWGLVTFRETSLLYEEGVSSTYNQKRVAAVIGHELAHMWFGNLVTLKWWDDLWLNEGFASYIEYKGVHHVHPDWKIMDQFLIDDLHGVMHQDASSTSHPILQSVTHPDDITEMFDAISYSKGASVIRMLEDFMGEEEFRNGITNYLNRFKFSNAMTQDLWSELEAVVTDLNITNIMNTWTKQMGFPVVIATRSNDVVTLKQERFLRDPEANTTADNSPYGFKWDIPITYITSQSKTIQRTWLYSNEDSITINIPRDVTWFKINCNQKGYYRVNYDQQNWQRLIELLENNVEALDVTDRANLLHDVFSLAEAGRVSYSTALNLTKYLKSETEYIPWKVAASSFIRLSSLLVESPSYSKLRSYVQSLVSNIYNKVTMVVSNDDSHLTRLLRPTVVELACKMGLSECIQEEVNIFSNWIGHRSSQPKPHPDLRSTVYSYGIKLAGGEKQWDTMWNMYLDETDAQERIKLLDGLAQSTEPWILKRFLQLAKLESNVRSQDFFNVLSDLSQNPIGTPIVWDFVREEWQYLVDRFTLNDRYLGRLIPSITKSFTTELKLKEMEIFFAQYPEAGAGKAARSRALDQVTKNIKWLKKHKETVEEWLDTLP